MSPVTSSSHHKVKGLKLGLELAKICAWLLSLKEKMGGKPKKKYTNINYVEIQ